MDHAELGMLIRQLRTDRGWGVRQLATRSGVNAGTVSHAERGSTERGLSLQSAEALDAALQANGRIVVAGQRSGNDDFAIARLTG